MEIFYIWCSGDKEFFKLQNPLFCCKQFVHMLTKFYLVWHTLSKTEDKDILLEVHPRARIKVKTCPTAGQTL
jgi:hypothetical protein